MSFPNLPLQLEGMRLKGDRDYLHGTDVLPIALQALSGGRPLNSIANIDLAFHGLARTGLTLGENVQPGHEVKAQLSCSIDGIRRKLLLMEDGRPITQRHPYPEEQIVAGTTIDVSSATAKNAARLPFTNIERWIAMTKALHHVVYPKAKGKWLFVRAKLATYQDAYTDPTEHCIRIEADFDGKLTRSTLSVDGRNLGNIFFALA